MALRVYETMIIFAAETAEDDIAGQLDKIEAIIKGGGGVVRDVDKWGIREFAYEIGHQRQGYYVVHTVDADPVSMDEVSRVLRLSDAVVRHKTLRIPDHVKKPLNEGASTKA